MIYGNKIDSNQTMPKTKIDPVIDILINLRLYIIIYIQPIE